MVDTVIDTNPRNRLYFSKEENRIKHGDISRRNWTKAEYRIKQEWRKGKHFSSGTEFKKGQQSPRYLPIGSKKVWGGYYRIKIARRGHEDSNWIFEHTIIMEQYIGRSLVKGEYIHHINGDKLDNRIENLYLCSNSKHRLLHSTEKLLKPLLDKGCIKFNSAVGEYYVC